MEKYTELDEGERILTILANNDHGSEWSTDNGETAHNDTWEMTTDGTKECGTISFFI